MLFEAAALLIGLALLFYSSERTVDSSVKLAQAFGVPPFIIGVVLVSLGTDVPEITNSVISSVLGHGDINVGNIFGSPLVQITLILGLAVFFGRKMRVKQAEIARLGIATLAATLLALILANDGDLTRADAAALIVSYITFLLYICRCDSNKLGIDRIRAETVKSRSTCAYSFSLPCRSSE